MCAMGGTGAGGGALIRPCTFLEELCEMGHNHDSLLTGYVMRLRSAQPLTRNQVKTALVHLRRQVPCLRLSFTTTGGSCWVQESTNDNIDLEMVDHDAVDDVMAAISRYRYRTHTGPLWCVKVLMGYPPNRAPMVAGETVSRPDTGLGTSSPEGDDRDQLLPRPDTGLGHHPSDKYQCRPLMPGEVIAVPLHDPDQNQNPNRCVILPPPQQQQQQQQQLEQGQEAQYDPMMGGAVGGDIGGAAGGMFPPFPPEYGAGASGYGDPGAGASGYGEGAGASGYGDYGGGASGYREGAGPSGYGDPGAGPSGYRGQHPEQGEEAYGSGGSDEGEVYSGVSPTEDAAMIQGEDIDPFNPERPMDEGPASEPRSRQSSNPSSAASYSASVSSSSHRSAQGGPSTTSGARSAATDKQKENELKLKLRLADFATDEDRDAAMAATAAATAVAPSSSRSSFIDTSSSASPLFLDTGSSSLSSSPRRGPSPPSLEAQPVVVGNFACAANLVLGIHQGIADGITAMRICGRLVKLLNDVVGEVNIDDSVPLDENTVGELREMLNTRMMALSDHAQLEELKVEMEARNHWVSDMSGLFGEPDESAGGRGGRRRRHRNRHEVFSLDSATTTRLLDRCQAEGVGLHSAFTAVANIALMDVLTARDVIRDNYSFYSSHGINLRQFYGGVDAPYLMGCLTAPVHISTSTPRHAADNFWDFVRMFAADFKHIEEKDEALRELAIMELNRLNIGDYEDILKEPLPPILDYYTSYLGDVTPLVTEGGPHVTVEYVESTMSRDKLGYACCHVLHLFRDSLCVTLNYSSRFLTVPLGKEYMSNLYRRLNEVS